MNPQLIIVTTPTPSLTFVPSQAKIEDQGTTFNQAGVTFNQAGIFFGGIYQGNEDGVPELVIPQ